jgi:hypothetical protein
MTISLSPGQFTSSGRLLVQGIATVAFLGGIASLTKQQLHGQPNLRVAVVNQPQRRQLFGFLDPKSVEPRLAGPPSLVSGAAPVIDKSLVRYVLNGRSDAGKDALAGMWTMTVPLHQKFAKEAVRRINQNKIVGDIVECGVWMGGMTMLMVFENMKEDTSRHFWLFDTFDGLPEPEAKDGARANRIYNDLKQGRNNKKIVADTARGTMLDGKWNFGPIDIVMNNLGYTGYPQENFHLVKGKVEDTLPVTPLPEKIAILRLDTDWYLSTKTELDYMYDHLQSGGVLIVDDYCGWQGARTAIDEFFRDTLKLDASSIAKETPCLVYWKP